MDDVSEGRTPRTKRVQSVIRTVEILRAIGNSGEDLTLADLAQRTGLPRSTVHRIVQTLQSVHFVALARETSGSASLTVLEGLNVRFLDQAIVGQGLRAITLVGSTFPAHCTANGKVLLAALPRAVLRGRLQERLESRTDRTITDPEHLMDELDRVATEGVAVDHEEHEVGISAIAALVVDDASFDSREEYLTEIVRRTAHDASLALGWRKSNGNSPGPKPSATID